jgi:hypothetical protein
MRVCDSCAAVVLYLTDTPIYISLKNGDWASVEAELCLRCKDKLVEMEKTAREHAILKLHKQFMEQMKQMPKKPITKIFA